MCTQDDDLRARFSGSPEKVVNLFSFIAEEVREILAQLGFKSLQEIIGRTESYFKLSDALEQYKTNQSLIVFEIALTKLIHTNFVKKLKNILQ